MKKVEIGDLVQLSLHGKFAIGEKNITDRLGIVISNAIDYDHLVLVKWFTTGATCEVHRAFIEKVEKNT